MENWDDFIYEQPLGELCWCTKQTSRELKKEQGTRGWAKLVVRILVMYMIAVKKPLIIEFFMLTNLIIYLLKIS